MAQTNETQNLNIFNRGPDRVHDSVFGDREPSPEHHEEPTSEPEEEDEEYHNWHKINMNDAKGILDNLKADSEAGRPYDMDNHLDNHQDERPAELKEEPVDINSVSNGNQEPKEDPDGLDHEQRAYIDSLPENMRSGVIEAMQSVNARTIEPARQRVITQEEAQKSAQRVDNLLHSRLKMRARGSLDELRNSAAAYSEGSKRLSNARVKAGITKRDLKGLSWEDAFKKQCDAYQNNPEYREAFQNMEGLSSQYYNAANKLGYSLTDAHKNGVDVSDIQKEFLERQQKGEFDAKDFGEPKLDELAEKIQKVISKLVKFCKRGLGLESPEEKQQRQMKKREAEYWKAKEKAEKSPEL